MDRGASCGVSGRKTARIYHNRPGPRPGRRLRDTTAACGTCEEPETRPTPRHRLLRAFRPQLPRSRNPARAPSRAQPAALGPQGPRRNGQPDRHNAAPPKQRRTAHRLHTAIPPHPAQNSRLPRQKLRPEAAPCTSGAAWAARRCRLSRAEGSTAAIRPGAAALAPSALWEDVRVARPASWLVRDRQRRKAPEALTAAGAQARPRGAELQPYPFRVPPGGRWRREAVRPTQGRLVLQPVVSR